MHCLNEELSYRVRIEINKNLGFLGGNPLKNKWISLVEKSQSGFFHHMRQNNSMKDFIDKQNAAAQEP